MPEVSKIPKIVSIISLVIAIVLFPPASLAFVSQDSVPGDTMYPVKRKLEDVVLFLASVHPKTRAWYAVAYSQRRYKETTSLIAKGAKKPAINSLDELIAQTTFAASQIKTVQNPKDKQELVEKLSKSIKEYDEGLDKTKQQLRSENKPKVTPTLTPTFPTPTTSLPDVTPTISHPVPTPTPSLSDEEDDTDLEKQIEDVQKKLRELDQQLRQESPLSQENNSNERVSGQDLNQLLEKLDSVDIEGLENITRQTIDSFYNLLPDGKNQNKCQAHQLSLKKNLGDIVQLASAMDSQIDEVLKRATASSRPLVNKKNRQYRRFNNLLTLTEAKQVLTREALETVKNDLRKINQISCLETGARLELNIFSRDMQVLTSNTKEYINSSRTLIMALQAIKHNLDIPSPTPIPTEEPQITVTPTVNPMLIQTPTLTPRKK